MNEWMDGWMDLYSCILRLVATVEWEGWTVEDSDTWEDTDMIAIKSRQFSSFML